ncbi:MAG: imidazole glycerol phosphate synthase subunit HisH [Endomicrobium sp.]|jgi:glutamine amidotransferase|nr:imidazole glycerol phosphate synthase subunit HisH [Endomicrobium sp.]
MSKKIAVIDYGFGNIESVLKALNFCKAQAETVNKPEALSGYGAAILPGVGSFGPAAEFLKISGFDEAVKNYVKSGKMLYGICLGFQLFFTKGFENGEHEGLDLIKGEVKKFDLKDKSLKIPHMGWNTVKTAENIYARKMFKGIEDGESFYFVHSYYALTQDVSKSSSVCDYGGDFCSSIAFENVWGSQFHPEKSGDKGLAVLTNFIKEAL